GTAGAAPGKCIPTTSSGRPVAIAHSMTGAAAVVVTNTTPRLQTPSRAANSAFVADPSPAAGSSAPASITRSASAKPSSPAAGVCALQAADTTSYPARPKASASPVASAPEPTTPTFA